MLIVVKRLVCPDMGKYGLMQTAGAFWVFCTSSVPWAIICTAWARVVRSV
jgi:hypothetical protein